MAKFRFSEQTIKAGFLVETPDWYKYHITKHFTKPSADGTSTNHILIFEGKSGQMEGVPVSKLISEKADWIALPIFQTALGRELTPEDEVDYDDLVGVTMEAYTKRNARQDGTPMNDLVEFRPVSG